MDKREIDIVVISDTHLGTYGCHSTELVNYLRSIKPKLMVLNGDIIDIWQFRKHFFPSSHMQVIREIFTHLSRGTKIVYITGNHDEALRRYSGLKLGNFQLADKLVLDIDGNKTWIFHGDVFDVTTKGSAKIIAKLGGHGYDLLILMNRGINALLKFIGREKMSLSKKVKNSVKKAVKWIGDFEQTAAELAIKNEYTHVICGHIHQPQIKVIKSEKGDVTYMNSGDWIENLTTLEYVNNTWEIYQYDDKKYQVTVKHDLKDANKIPSLNVISDEVSFFFKSILPSA